TPDEAEAKLAEPLYDADEQQFDIEYFCKKMRITQAQFEELMNAPVHDYSEIANWDSRQRIETKVQLCVQRALGRRINVYS
ncbi:N-acetyl sugar amidotransferase, partial [Pseudomonas aeruginosa]